MSRHHNYRGSGNGRSFVGMVFSRLTRHSSRFTFHGLSRVPGPVSLITVVMVAVIGLCFAGPAYSQNPKLIVKDASGNNTVFSVDDTGDVFTGGTDATNAFQLQVMGHSGGSSHVQLTTNQTNSKISLIASTTNDNAPRFQAVGPQDSGNPGWVLFDFGSALYDLPNAEFRLRHYDTTGNAVMLRVIGRSTVSFPTGNVQVHSLAGSYSNNSAYVCVHNDGTIYASESPCP